MPAKKMTLHMEVKKIAQQYSHPLGTAVSIGVQCAIHGFNWTSGPEMLVDALTFSVIQIYIQNQIAHAGREFLTLKNTLGSRSVDAISSTLHRNKNSARFDMALFTLAWVTWSVGEVILFQTVSGSGMTVAGYLCAEIVIKLALATVRAQGISFKDYFQKGQETVKYWYDYYTFTSYKDSVQVAALDKMGVQTAHVHYLAHSYDWKKLSLPMQCAFNLQFEKHELDPIELNGRLKESDSFTDEERHYYAKHRFESGQTTPADVKLFYDHNFLPPSYYLPAQKLKKIPLAEASEIPSLSEAKVCWAHQYIVVHNKTLERSQEKQTAFAKAFFQYSLIPPSEKFTFEVPLNHSSYSPTQVMYVYNYYILNGHGNNLSASDKKRLNAILKQASIDLSLPPIRKLPRFDVWASGRNAAQSTCQKLKRCWSLVKKLPQRILDIICTVNEQQQLQEEHLIFHLEDPEDTLESVVFPRSSLHSVAETCRQFFAFFKTDSHVRSLQNISLKELKETLYDAQFDSELKTLDANRVNFLHPTMISHLPCYQIQFVFEKELIREIPDQMLPFIHPRIFSLLTDHQKEHLRQYQIDTQSLEEIDWNALRFIWCPWILDQIPHANLYEASAEALTLSAKRCALSSFHQDFVYASKKEDTTFVLNNEKLFSIGVGDAPLASEVEALPYDISHRFRAVCEFYEAEVKEASMRKLRSLLCIRGARPYFEGEAEKVHYDFKHMVYKLEQLRQTNPDDEVKRDIAARLASLFDNMLDCKTSWVEGLRRFEDVHCSCAGCEQRQQNTNTNEVSIKVEVARKLRNLEVDCFQKVVSRHHPGHAQAIHVAAHYAYQLPHLNLKTAYADHYQNNRQLIGRTTSLMQIENEFKKLYKKEMIEHVKRWLVSDDDMKKAVEDYLKSMLQQQAKDSFASSNDSGVLSAYLHDLMKEQQGDQFKLKEGFVYALLHLCGHLDYVGQDKDLHQALNSMREICGLAESDEGMHEDYLAALSEDPQALQISRGSQIPCFWTVHLNPGILRRIVRLLASQSQRNRLGIH